MHSLFSVKLIQHVANLMTIYSTQIQPFTIVANTSSSKSLVTIEFDIFK